MTEWLERHQIAIALGALGVGSTVALVAPGIGSALTPALLPALALLLFATFLGVPFRRITQSFRDRRFLVTLLALNFVVAPLVAFGVSRIVAHDGAVLVGVLLVLLTPCVDYVIVFTRIAGGDAARLAAATPLLMLAQLALLPPYLWLLTDAAIPVPVGPFVEAFLIVIAAPLLAAVLVQLFETRHVAARRIGAAGNAAMVPLLAAVLILVVASQLPAVTDRLGDVVAAVPVFVAFAVLMAGAGWMAARLTRAAPPAGRAILFSGVTRNSLVVLPLALALPAPFAVAPLVVVTQTLVELVLIVALVPASRRLVR